LTLTVQAMGLVPQVGLLRSSASQGILIYMTDFGGSGLGTKIKQGYDCINPGAALERLNQPDPKIEAGLR